MNNLSWFIYLADMAGTIDCSLGIVFVCCLIAAAATGVVWMCNDWGGASDKAARARCVKGWWLLLKIIIGVLLIDVLLPGQKTIYAIAASEYGEELLKTNTATKAQKALDAWLDKQIGEQKPEKQP